MLNKSKLTNSLNIGEIRAVHAESRDNKYNKIIKDLNISTPLFKLLRNLLGRELTVVSTEDESKENIEIANRLKGIQHFDEYLKKMALLPYSELAIHELVYAKDEITGDLQISELNELPNHYVVYDLEKYKKTNGLYYKDKKSKEFAIKPDEFHIAVFGQNIEYPLGYGLFRYGIEQVFEDLQTLDAQLRALQKKYGSVIPVFGYDPLEAETPEGLKKLEDRVQGITGIGEGSILAIPLGGFEQNLKDGFQFISLADLRLDMHRLLKKDLQDAIEVYITGTRSSKSDEGSNAKERVGQEEKDNMVTHLTKILEDNLNFLIKKDAELFGYNPEEYRFLFKEKLSENKAIEREARRADMLSKKVSQKTALVNAVATMKAAGLKDKVVAQMLDLDVKIVRQIQAQVDVQPNVAGGNNANVKPKIQKAKTTLSEQTKETKQKVNGE